MTPTFDRRAALRLGLGSALALALPRLSWGDDEAAAAAPPRSCIVLWLQGGPSQLELWDPKPEHRNGGPTRAIPTRTEGLRFAHTLPRLAERSDKLAVIRSLSSTEGDHARATQYLLSGRKPLAGLAAPSLGAAAASELSRGAAEGILPSLVRIGAGVRDGVPDEGFLPGRFAPFQVERAGQPIPDLSAPEGVSAARQARRLALLEGLDEGPEARARLEALRRAASLRGRPEQRAFDLSEESEGTRARYGDHDFGRGCLLARRLVEAGVCGVEVVSRGWDTHQDNFAALDRLGGQLDEGFSALLDDLAERGRLDSTLIVCVGEFGRTPIINGREGRDHYPRAFSAALAGGRARRGLAYGATSKDGLEVVSQRLAVPDFIATCVAAAGGDPSRERLAGDRPVRLIEGRVIPELLVM